MIDTVTVFCLSFWPYPWISAEVVGILQRGTADVVASMSPQDEEQLAAAGGNGRQVSNYA